MAEALLDANVLIRMLTGTPRPLAVEVKGMLETAERRGCALLLTPLTLAEVIYVLESVYAWPRRRVAEQMLDALEIPALHMLEREVVQQALVLYRDIPRLDFADVYIGALAVHRGHGVVVSLDRELRRAPGVTLVQRAEQVPGR